MEKYVLKYIIKRKLRTLLIFFHCTFNGSWNIILNDVVIGDNCKIEDTIIDKNTVIGDNSVIGTGNDMTPNKDNPKVLSSGLNVIGKKLILPAGLVVERNVRIFSSTDPKEIKVKHIPSGETLK